MGFFCRVAWTNESGAQGFQSVERENSVQFGSRQGHEAHRELAVSRKRLQQGDHISAKRDAVAKCRRGACELHRLTIIHAIGNEVAVPTAGKRRSSHRDFRAPAALHRVSGFCRGLVALPMNLPHDRLADRVFSTGPVRRNHKLRRRSVSRNSRAYHDQY